MGSDRTKWGHDVLCRRATGLSTRPGSAAASKFADWLPEDHLAYFVSDIVDQLDLSAIHAWYDAEKRGQPPYDPVLMTKLLVYGYCTGVFSSRRLQKRIQEDIPFKVLAAGNEPDFRTISDFRKIHLVALEQLFEQVLELALGSGSVKLGRVSLDGTKIKANASKHKAMSYGRAKEEQRQLREEVKELLAQAAAADEEEDRRHGEPAGRRVAGGTTAAGDAAGQDQAGQEGDRTTGAGEGGDGREKRRGGAACQARGQGPIQLHRSRIAHYEKRGRIRAGLQCAGGGRGGAGTHRRAVSDASRQRQRTTPADGGGDRAASGAAAAGHSGQQRILFGSESDLPGGRRRAGAQIAAYVSTGRQKHGNYRQPCERGRLPAGASRVDRMTFSMAGADTDFVLQFFQPRCWAW